MSNPIPPKNPGPGRPKGSKNKLTLDIKALILGALKAKGGQKWLESQMDQNPVAFMTLIGKVMPTQIQGDPENPIATLSISPSQYQQITKAIVEEV